ncbi:MAG: MBL fold metallo-hydrolase [Actinomycetaceae bacterium]|nr:MBL fold metallo-hydrolase [Actinomycetaceae bacterium]
MRLEVIPSPYYGANCVVATQGAGQPALVIDPSAGITDKIKAALDQQGATLAGVLLTHGHPDHVWEAAEVASWNDVPCWLPGPDRYRMDDPMGRVTNPPGVDLPPWRIPEDLRDVPAGSVEIIPGAWMKMVPAPGHTEGSAVFLFHSPVEIVVDGTVEYSSELPAPWALSGDVLFAGSVGRTDLPGGDETHMRHSLRTIANAVDPQTRVIPGHGPLTTLAREIESNPYLIRAMRIG